MKEQLDDDHPDWQISPLWLHLVEKFDDPIPEHRQEDDEEHGDTDIESDGWGDVGAWRKHTSPSSEMKNLAPPALNSNLNKLHLPRY